MLGRSILFPETNPGRYGDDLHYYPNSTAEEPGQLTVAAVYVGGGLEDVGHYYGFAWNSDFLARCIIDLWYVSTVCTYLHT